MGRGVGVCVGSAVLTALGAGKEVQVGNGEEEGDDTGTRACSSVRDRLCTGTTDDELADSTAGSTGEVEYVCGADVLVGVGVLLAPWLIHSPVHATTIRRPAAASSRGTCRVW